MVNAKGHQASKRSQMSTIFDGASESDTKDLAGLCAGVLLGVPVGVLTPCLETSRPRSSTPVDTRATPSNLRTPKTRPMVGPTQTRIMTTNKRLLARSSPPP